MKEEAEGVNLKPIDLEKWERREHFVHYFSKVPCTYSMTVKVDVTRLVEEKEKFYPAMLYCLTTLVNRHEEFRMALDPDGRPGIYDRLVPCYTVFHKDSETFSTIWTEDAEDYAAFLRAYQRDVEKFGAVKAFEAKPGTPCNTFSVSMIPWESFEGFHLELQKGFGYFAPIFTLGRICEENGVFRMPVAVQVHHAVCDGFHVCRFLGELRELIATGLAGNG